MDFLNSLTLTETEILLDQQRQMINTLDDKCLEELLKGYGSDTEALLDVMMEETFNVINLKKYEGKSLLTDFPAIQSGFEEFLREENLNYFVHSVLTEFEMNWHNVEWFSMIQLYRLLCLIAARDHSKSFSCSFAYPLWRLYRYHRDTALRSYPPDIKFYKEGMLITNEYKLAKKLIKKVREEAEQNPILRERLFPGYNTSGWGSESLVCKNGAEMTLSSFRTSNRGPHPGWIICDDFLDKSAMYSKEQRDKFVEVFNAEVMNMLLPQGQCLVVGTPFHEKDLYATLKEDPQWAVFEYPAVFPDGHLLWRNRYDFEALKNKRISLGSMIFSREILVRPISDSTSIFPWEILNKAFINMKDFRLVENRMSYPVPMVKVSIGVDLALSANTGADYTVMIVLGKDSLGLIHLMNLTRLHGASYNEQIATLQRLNSAFMPDNIIMEVNGFQRVMSELAQEAGITNIIQETTTAHTKKDLYEGLPSLAVTFERGIYRFPRGDENSIEKTNLLCSELNSIAFDDTKGTLESVSEHDDTGMAFLFANKGLKYINNTFRISTVGS
jgi:hypothetical protein